MTSPLPHILFVNPWIHDFTAYDFWAKPLGLLQLAAICRMHGFDVSYIDCQDRFHPLARPSDPLARNGRGPFLKTRIDPPAVLKGIRRRFSRYGIRPEWFARDLATLPRPDVILITCMMTYWYSGLMETIAEIRKVHPKTPILLGGVYATLWHEHARSYSGADRVISGSCEATIIDIMAEVTGVRQALRFDPDDLDTYPIPAFDLQRTIGYIPLLTSRGCPFSCDYCASNLLQPKRMRRSPAAVIDEIRFWHEKFGVREFAFYDDALLMDAAKHAVPLFEGIAEAGLNVNFHTPNGVHIRGITPKMADLMFRAGMKTLRLGLETTDFDHRNDNKVGAAEFDQALAYLREAGFPDHRLGAYLLAGLPGQDPASVAASMAAVRSRGITPHLTYYSPLPGTPMWEAARAASRYDLAADPVFTNNAILPCWDSEITPAVLTRLKFGDQNLDGIVKVDCE
ncbi:MAG: radical SAM protein [Desulfobacteraceae bacterium]|nr:MAG: radical SAM protein [Desulfobacteraceae bacterium]